MQSLKKTINFGRHILSIETGAIARQADGAVLVDLDGTTVLVTVVSSKKKEEPRDFLPLRVDYQEKFYAAGKIPGGFFKREGRPSERETLIARLIDRPLRPLFNKKFSADVQIVAQVLSINPEIEPDIVAMIGASAATAISGLPLTEAMAAARVGYLDGCYILNPTQTELETSRLDLVVAGTESSVLMVESQAAILSEEVMLGAVMFGLSQFQPVINMINELAAEVATPALDWQEPVISSKLIEEIDAGYKQQIATAYSISQKELRAKTLREIREDIASKFLDEEVLGQAVESGEAYTKMDISKVVDSIERNFVRSQLLAGSSRIDGRDFDSIRPIDIRLDVLPRTHGSAIFTRGETQAIAVVTLGSARDAQMLDNILGEAKDNFMLHYNFPPFSVGEIGMIGSPKRREIGHGRLAKRGLFAVIPDAAEGFPYTIRLVCEVTESNGSSSMASICGGSLAMMAAGVPLKSAVAGIAMGLIKEQDEFVVLSDILGDEDHLGDMDFKVAGTAEGITALQMDIKINGITEEIMQQALVKARNGRMHILDKMNKALNTSRTQMSDYVPKIFSFKISPDKIKEVIGKGGSTIKTIIEETGATIDISENGTVQIAAPDAKSGEAARKRVQDLAIEPEIGKIYQGKVIRIETYGAFVNILPSKDGLVHISQIAEHRVSNVTDELQEGQMVSVKLTEIDNQGRLKLSIKAAKLEEPAKVHES